MIASLAFLLYPCPSESEAHLTFFNSDSFCNSVMGSAPGDNTKITGVLLVESENDLVRSNGGGET